MRVIEKERKEEGVRGTIRIQNVTGECPKHHNLQQQHRHVKLSLNQSYLQDLETKAVNIWDSQVSPTKCRKQYSYQYK